MPDGRSPDHILQRAPQRDFNRTSYQASNDLLTRRRALQGLGALGVAAFIESQTGIVGKVVSNTLEALNNKHEYIPDEILTGWTRIRKGVNIRENPYIAEQAHADNKADWEDITGGVEAEEIYVRNGLVIEGVDPMTGQWSEGGKWLMIKTPKGSRFINVSPLTREFVVVDKNSDFEKTFYTKDNKIRSASVAPAEVGQISFESPEK